jgi:hypothetical protein
MRHCILILFQLVLFLTTENGAWVAQSVKCLTTDWTTELRSPTEAKDFSYSPCVETGSETHPAFFAMGTGVKRGRGVKLTNHPISCGSQDCVGAIPPLSLGSWRSGTDFYGSQSAMLYSPLLPVHSLNKLLHMLTQISAHSS